MYLYWSLYIKVGLALFKSVEAKLGDRCHTENDCGGYSGASCLNGSCSCVFTIQDNQCTVDAKFSNNAIVIGVVCGTVLLVFLIIIAILLYRNFRYPRNKDVKKSDDLHSSEINTRPSGYMYLQVTKVIQITPIKVESLQSHVQEFLRHDGLEVRKEYMHLDTLVTYSEATVGNLPQNIEKNRSAKVPYDFNRVKLLETSDYPGENYINASHVLNQEKRTVTHFHIYALNQLILAKEFIENVKCIRSNFRFQAQPSPIVVHSGSAVEWSGVFVLVDYLTQRVMKGDDSVDIPAVTLQLLDERKSLITEEQYVLVYSCIREYVECDIKPKKISLDENEDVMDYEELP
uniref:Uncharacterized protein LOC111103938 isoform X2 n=1 Tax=Crassostrea virginica TaxID=6565 RepID=A0A8B8AST8_CRAVI|nr:uncharacterized protein LOC111103938 isoform X2 [Crassostrea virginica]